MVAEDDGGVFRQEVVEACCLQHDEVVDYQEEVLVGEGVLPWLSQTPCRLEEEEPNKAASWLLW